MFESFNMNEAFLKNHVYKEVSFDKICVSKGFDKGVFSLTIILYLPGVSFARVNLFWSLEALPSRLGVSHF